MGEECSSKWLDVTWIVLKSIVSFAIVRIITKRIRVFPGNYGEAFSVALFTFWMYRCVQKAGKKEGYTLADCRVTRPVVSWKDVAFAVGFLGFHYWIMSLAADRVYYTGMLFGEIIRLSIPEILHSGIGSGFNEELVFRGYMLKSLEDKVGIKKAIGIVSVAFGLLHALNGNMTPRMIVCIAIGTGMLGAMFAVITYKTGSIWRAVLVHACCNLSSMVIDYERGNCLLILDFPETMSNEMIFCMSYTVISVVCCGVMFMYWRKTRKGQIIMGM